MSKRGLIDGQDNMAINDYCPVWLCCPSRNTKCDKVNCQKECFHTLNPDYAVTGIQPIYPFAEQANQSLRADQMSRIASAINKAKEPTTIKLVTKKPPSKLIRLAVTITLMLLAALGWSCLFWLISKVVGGIF